MSKTKVKHWAGFIKPETMQQEGWYEIWLDSAIIAEKNNSELVVFRIPNENPELYNQVVTEIEQLLQHRFPDIIWNLSSDLREQILKQVSGSKIKGIETWLQNNYHKKG